MATNRRCRVCGGTFPEEDFPLNGKSVAGKQRRRPNCRKCEVKRVTDYRKSNPYTYITKYCNKCSEEFRIRIDKEPGLIAVLCKQCKNRSENGKPQEATNAIAD